MQIGESSNIAEGVDGRIDPLADLGAGPEGILRIHIVDSRYVPVKIREPLEYRIVDDAGNVITSGHVSGDGCIDINYPDSGSISLWLDGEFLTVHKVD